MRYQHEMVSRPSALGGFSYTLIYRRLTGYQWYVHFGSPPVRSRAAFGGQAFGPGIYFLSKC